MFSAFASSISDLLVLIDGAPFAQYIITYSLRIIGAEKTPKGHFDKGVPEHFLVFLYQFFVWMSMDIQMFFI
jgi:hypothetical protein